MKEKGVRIVDRAAFRGSLTVSKEQKFEWIYLTQCVLQLAISATWAAASVDDHIMNELAL